MTMPSPFELGAKIGGNVSGAMRDISETSMLDKILKDASQSGRPEDIQDAMNTIISRVSPERREMAIQVLQNKYNQMQTVKTQTAMKDIADKIEKENPNSSLHKMLADIYRSDMPLEQKERMIKSVTSSVPYRLEQQQRLQLDSILKRYNSRIKEIDAEIKNQRPNEEGKKQKEKLTKQRENLIKERDDLLNFQSLKEENKPVFDQENPEHVKRFEELDKEFAGDRVKVHEMLSKEFNL
jgi:hypothetical protein